ncbi:penicillin-binding protein 2 [Candidatus Uhrbacteria bacterium]|nr:penicillin-binding protein 2 [Candidatus Uhrbacteria bacterium]
MRDAETSSPARRWDRLHSLAVFIFLLNVVVVWKLFDVQVAKGALYSTMAADEHQFWEKLLPKRGEVFVVDDGKPIQIITNKNQLTLYAVPISIDKPGWTAKLLAETLGLDQIELEKKLSRPNDQYEIIKRKITDDEVAKVKDLKLPGLEFSEEPGRSYPDQNLFSHVTGFVGFSGDQKKGQYGIEGHWDDVLAGQTGYLKTDKDLTGRWIASAGRSMEEAQDGSSLVLTLDRTIQFYACKQLEEAARKFKASGGSLIVMNPMTGAVITMCGVPDFDPNIYNLVENARAYNNPAIFNDYEPGSIFKAVTMAGGLDANLITPDTTYDDTGIVDMVKYVIKNSDGKAHGITTMTGVLEQSLNTGTVFVSARMGLDLFRRYVKDFGFGQPAGIELDTEGGGNISSLEKKGQIFMATASFGQGITVTPLQMAAAYSAIANGGKLMRPYVVDQIIKPDGQVVKTQPEVIRQVISNRAAKVLTGMLVSVVKRGHSKKAGIPGYLIAAKTGTAQLAGPGGVYSKETIHSFIGYGPADDPKFVILARLDKPQGAEFAESSVAPLFNDVARFIINYWKIQPTERE